MVKRRRCDLSCVACCKLEFRGKPGGGGIGVLCKHAAPGEGCAIYHKRRPAVCDGFKCPWLVGITRTKPSDLGALIYWSDGRSFLGGSRIATICVILEPGITFSAAIKAEVCLLAEYLGREYPATEGFVVDVWSPEHGGHCEFWMRDRRGRRGKTT